MTTPLTPVLLLRVAATWPLPGLGLLALPDAPTPYLMAQNLHNILTVKILYIDNTSRNAFATVEEVSRPDDSTPPTRCLLLDLETTRELPAGTSIWLAAPDAAPASLPAAGPW